MSSPKHTPGPWRINWPYNKEPSGCLHGPVRDSGWSVTIAKFSPAWDSAKDDGYQYTHAEAAANARLIAAAPDLFRDLRALITIFDDNVQSKLLPIEARDHIARARLSISKVTDGAE